MSLLLYIPKLLCRVTVFGCSYNGYSKQEYELVGWDGVSVRPWAGGREAGSYRRHALWRQPGPGVAGDREYHPVITA